VTEEVAMPTQKSPGLLIVGGNRKSCGKIAEIFSDSDFPVVVVYSAPDAVADILRGVSQVAIIDTAFLGPRAGDLVALLKRCNPRLCIILLTGNTTDSLLRNVRREGIFYHALEPTDAEDYREIREAVRCAFDSLPGRRAVG
jgi:DNA-binding NtrC family response regulator